MEQNTTIRLDLAERFFQAHGVDAPGRAVVKARLTRDQVGPFFAQTPPCLVAMEAYSGAHHRALRIGALGHEVRLVPPSRVKPFVGRQKNDAADAAEIATPIRVSPPSSV